MLKSCHYCGRIHDSHFDCGKRPNLKRFKPQDSFRSTQLWQRKRSSIRARDLNLCRVCLSQGKIVCDDLSVHHIIPLEESWELRLTDSNLITLCGRCHELAEAGRISRQLLHDLTESAPQLSPLVRHREEGIRCNTDWGHRKEKYSRNEMG